MANKPEKKASHSTRLILASVGLGLLTGIVIGDYAGGLKLLGDAYIGMLHMTVLPYILFSLIANIGRLDRAQAGLLARAGVLTMLGLWALAALVMIAMALALPLIPSGAFFSSSLITPAPKIDFLDLFIPANLFKSLAGNSVPAVVVFCLMFGTALMGFDNKKTLLEQFDLVTAVLQKVNGMVVRLAPLGIFAVTASAAGTLTVEQFGLLQAYVLTMGSAALLLVLLIYPLVISSCTSLRWSEVIGASRDALITAFVLGSTFAVIPALIQSAEKLIQQLGNDEDDSSHLPQLMLPLAYPFPDAGKILTLLFIPFAAWFYGSPLNLLEIGALVLLGPMVMFAKVVAAISFLLDFYEIPADIFQLFLASGVLMGRLADTVGAMYLVTFTVLTSAVIGGSVRVQWKKLATRLLISVAGIGALALLLNTLMYYSYEKIHDKRDVVLGMQTLDRDIPITVLARAEPNPKPLKGSQTHGERMVARGLLRVGFNPDYLPFSFFNGQDELVGFDIELMHKLAQDLDVGLEFVPYEIEELSQGLADDHFDIAVSGITATAERSGANPYSDPYLLVNMAMVVPDHRRRDLRDQAAIRARQGLRVGVRAGSNFAARAGRHFPDMEIVPLGSEKDFFEGSVTGLDALLTTAEGGSAWTLLYPHYSTINPVNHTERAPLVIAIPPEMDIEEYLEMWITLRRLDGTLDRLFDYWIKGRTDDGEAHRWSVIRDMLNWDKQQPK